MWISVSPAAMIGPGWMASTMPGSRRLRFAGGPAVHIEVVADHDAGSTRSPHLHRALEKPALGRMHPGEIREVPHACRNR